MPSLAELGAFDLPPPPARPRAAGRLTDEDLRGLPARGTSTPGAAPLQADASVAARAKPVSWPGLKAEPPRPNSPTPPAAPAGLPRSGSAEPVDEPVAAAAAPAAPKAAAPGAARVVPGVTVGWADLQSAVAAGWIKPEAAHALWARWLARKPLTHMEAGPDDPAGPDDRAEPDQAPDAGGPQGLEPAAGDAVPRGAPEQPTGSEPGPAVPPHAARPGDDGPVNGAVNRDAPPSGARRPAGWEGPQAEAAHAAEGARAQAEVLEPLPETKGRRAAERASAGRRIEVVDVIEVPSLAPSTRPADAAMALHFFTALLAAALAALCVGAGSVLFGPWGAAAAALGWALLVWGRTARLHRQGRDASALWGAHLVLPLLAAALWQGQVAMGWWPPERPLDLFADLPAASASASSGISLDWRLLWLCLLPLLAAFYWLVRLRQAGLLAVVTLLLWGVAFQAVAGVLESLGLAFHGMSTFALLLGGLTLAAALYIDLRVRRERAPDFARWPYLGGALLLGVGWVSLAVLPSWVLLPRYVAWLVFLAWALSLQRVGVVAIALALAGFELAWALARASGSGLLGIVAWVLWLAAVGGVAAFLLPRRQAWSGPLQWWMPARWRAWYAPARGPARARTGPAQRLSDTAA